MCLSKNKMLRWENWSFKLICAHIIRLWDYNNLRTGRAGRDLMDQRFQSLSRRHHGEWTAHRCLNHGVIQQVIQNRRCLPKFGRIRPLSFPAMPSINCPYSNYLAKKPLYLACFSPWNGLQNCIFVENQASQTRFTVEWDGRNLSINYQVKSYQRFWPHLSFFSCF